MHPSESIRGAKGRQLEGKRIVLGITGSIAAVESFELVRELIRYGTEVRVVMTPEAAKLMTPYTMEFASGHKVITELTGATEHIDLLGDYEGRADLLLVSPCTANTISKMALGIDDTPVTTMATVAIGGKVPVLVAPAMHLTMYNNPAVQRNVGSLKEMGVQFIGPVVVGKKARVATVGEIVSKIIAMLSRGDLKGRKVLIIGGSSEEPIDQVRVITNTGTGETAVQLATAAAERGADVELWTGRMQVPVPADLNRRSFRRVEELLAMAKEADHDIVIVPASLSDYAPVPEEGKIPSGRKSLDIELKALPKVLPVLRDRAKVLVGFKAEVGISDAELARRARKRLKEYGLDLIVANDLSNVQPSTTVATLMPAKGKQIRFSGTKMELAGRILDEVVKVVR
ncbi:MAG: bifunctional phosphopantothenoylcysteine decarboxylase/phosphopantothenate--cysteine ligase CoaBC [Candidatus Saccharibacteria bacterium]